MTARTLEPFDPEAVAPWRLGEGSRGALLIHGFAGTPPELRRLGEVLAEHGFRCHAPSLPGHGTTPQELARTRWQDWASCVSDAFNDLAAECSDVVVAGQSMGGTLALHLAAHDDRVRAVASLAAPIWLSGPLPPLLPVIKRIVRWHRAGDDVDLWNPAGVEELHSYGMRPTRSIDELRKLCAVVRNELAEIRAPVMVLHGERDRTIDPRCGREIARRLIGSEAVRLQMLPRSGHAISVDVDRDAANADVLQWFERFAPATAAVV
ncbi:MAG: alpha/beta fold hydrolase [Candidatus Dormiibacterota bacterium]